jgi:hypothetical protein
MKQLKVGPVQTMVGSALGTVAAAAFSLWAGRLRIYPPYVAGLDVLITGTVVIATNYLASVIRRVDLRTALGWAAVAFVVWWTIQAPASATHVAHNVGVFMSTASDGIGNFFSSV